MKRELIILVLLALIAGVAGSLTRTGAQSAGTTYSPAPSGRFRASAVTARRPTAAQEASATTNRYKSFLRGALHKFDGNQADFVNPFAPLGLTNQLGTNGPPGGTNLVTGTNLVAGATNSAGTNTPPPTRQY